MGATLIERMLVIGILWILTFLLFPNFADALVRALAARDQANERIAATEEQIYRLRGNADGNAAPAGVPSHKAPEIPATYRALLKVGAGQ